MKSLSEQIEDIISDDVNSWEKTYEILELIDSRIDSCLEEQSKYHEDYTEGLHRLKEMLSK